MVSKTKMLALVKAFDWREAEKGFADSPELIDFRDQRGRNFLHLCAMVDVEKAGNKKNPKDSIKMAALLIELGLDISGAAFERHNWRATPLWHAMGKNYPLATYLLEQGCDPEHCLWGAAMGGNVRSTKLLLAHGATVDPVYASDGSTPLQLAVKGGHWAVAELLLEAGAKVDYQGPDKRTPLHWALKNGADKKDLRRLLKYGARGDIGDGDGRTAAEIMGRKKDPGFGKLAEQFFA